MTDAGWAPVPGGGAALWHAFAVADEDVEPVRSRCAVVTLTAARIDELMAVPRGRPCFEMPDGGDRAPAARRPHGAGVVTGVQWLSQRDLAEWLALRRVARGAVVLMRGRYCDGGKPMVADVAAALPALIDAGHVALTPVDLRGLRRASLTIPRGCQRFAELTGARAVEVDDSREATAPGPAARRGDPPWAMSTFDDRCHAVPVSASRSLGRRVALCGLMLDSSVALHSSPEGAQVCGTCAALALVEIGR